MFYTLKYFEIYFAIFASQFFASCLGRPGFPLPKLPGLGMPGPALVATGTTDCLLTC
jgi:hypothetical protein